MSEFRRVLVLGRCGAGKSHFSEWLGKELGLPVIHLDFRFWKSNWTMPVKEEWASWIRGAANEERWVMDGNYLTSLGMRLARADLVIFLEIPLWLSLFRYFCRIAAKNRIPGRQIPFGCQDEITWRMVKSIFQFSRQEAPLIFQLASAHPRFVAVKSADAKQYVTENLIGRRSVGLEL